MPELLISSVAVLISAVALLWQWRNAKEMRQPRLQVKYQPGYTQWGPAWHASVHNFEVQNHGNIPVYMEAPKLETGDGMTILTLYEKNFRPTTFGTVAISPVEFPYRLEPTQSISVMFPKRMLAAKHSEGLTRIRPFVQDGLGNRYDGEWIQIGGMDELESEKGPWEIGSIHSNDLLESFMKVEQAPDDTLE